MPFYQALVRPGLMTETQRQSFAGDITDVHCSVTGAPRSFVQVLITEDDQGHLPNDRTATVSGTIRAGRTAAEKAEISDRISHALAERAGVDPDSVHTSTMDVDASYTMEGGVLLPQPGSPEEAAWKESEGGETGT